MATTPAIGTVKGISSAGAPSVATPSQTVLEGGSIYVQVAMFGTGLTAPTVADAQGGVYNLLLGGANGSVYLWVFRRSAALRSSTTFTVTVTPSSSTSSIEVLSIEVLDDGGTDVISTLHTGTSTSESSSVSTGVSNDLVLFLGADNSGT